MKILFIEDNLDLATSIIHQFELCGFNNIDYCSTGKQAVFTLNETKYDIIILDIILPDIDGLMILEKIKQKSCVNNNSFIIITTGITHNSLIENASSLGANYFISKPYQFSNLLNTITVIKKILNIPTSKINKTNELNLFCDNYLGSYNINENLKGYNLIIQAFSYLVTNESSQTLRITKDIYPQLAKANCTDVSNIERNIRNALNSSRVACEQNLTNLSFLLKMKKTYFLSNKQQ